MPVKPIFIHTIQAIARTLSAPIATMCPGQSTLTPSEPVLLRCHRGRSIFSSCMSRVDEEYDETRSDGTCRPLMIGGWIRVQMVPAHQDPGGAAHYAT